jgi:putative ABC transport system permease protein
VAFVLLIACANVENLLLAKSMSRQKEMALRSAVGAKSATIFTQLLTESLLLAAVGGALGIGVGYAILQSLLSVMPPDTLPSEADLSLNFPILLFTLTAPRWRACCLGALRRGTRRALIPTMRSERAAAQRCALGATAL